MISLPTLNRFQQVVRARICASCAARSREDDGRPLHVPRRCETRCAFFARLPGAHRVALTLDPMLGNFERALKRIGRLRMDGRGRRVAAALRELTCR